MDEVVAACWYDFPVQGLVTRFKYEGDAAAGRALADLLVDRLCAAEVVRPDWLVPVPMHRTRLAYRGFNQAYDLARNVARRTGIELRHHDLRRQRRTRQQAGLDARQRLRNLHGALTWAGPAIGGRNVTLVDDVMTTGATVEACTRVLRRAGAGQVQAWVAARARAP